MASKFKNLLVKKGIAFTLILSMVLPLVYLPNLAPRAQAIFGVGDITIDSVSNILVPIFKGIGQLIAKKMLDDVVQSTIKWANSGFDGNPAFITNPNQYFGNLASGAAGDFIARDKNLGFLCSPFQARIKLSLIKQQAGPAPQFQCTIEKIGANIDNFSRDFTQGGWDAWFAITSSEASDPYGAYIQANASINSQISKTVDSKKAEVAQSQGFLSFKTCPRGKTAGGISKEDWKAWQDGNETQKLAIETKEENLNWNVGVDPGTCLVEEKVNTPGSVIMASINKGATAGIDKLISADSINAIASAFLSGVLQRYVFSKKGLADDSSNAAARDEIIDVDGDKIPDGYDTDGDGQLNICHNGIKDSRQPASNTNCIGSKSTTSSPYFIQLCKATDDVTVSLQSYKRFIEDNPRWDDNAVRSWENRTIAVADTVDSFVSTLSRYEIKTFDKVVNNFGQYSNHLNKMVSSLIKDKDIKGDGLTPRGLPWYAKIGAVVWGGGIGLALIFKDNLTDRGNNGTIARTHLANEQRITYLSTFKGVIGQCDNPDTAAIDRIPIPVGVEGSDSILSCSPSNSSVEVGSPITWLADSAYNTASTTAYQWTGDDIDSAPTTAPEDLLKTYLSTGNKSATITATLSNGSTTSAFCSPDVTVIPRGGLQ